MSVDLSRARDYYEAIGAGSGVASVNAVGTTLGALSSKVLDQLEGQAAWQIHAAAAVFAAS